MPIAIAAIAAAMLTPLQAAQPESAPADALDWRELEVPILTDHVQLTTPELFLKAGEAYFSPSGQNVIFQATPVPEDGAEPTPHYEMYVGRIRDPFMPWGEQADRPPSLTGIYQISQTGSANTCGWFHPTEENLVMFGSTVLPPLAPDSAGYQRGSGRYRWQFPPETEIVSGRAPSGEPSRSPFSEERELEPEKIFKLKIAVVKPLFIEPGYSAEGSWSPDGKFVLYTWVNPETDNPDIYLRDPATGYVTPIVTAEGYDGGPFFSPDGHWITYRSDRAGNNLLQVFIAELDFDDQGRPNGIKREIQLTDNEFVNWGPFWHPSGAFLVYATNEAAPEQHNYEVFAIDARGLSDSPRRLRLTHAEGFDGLPVFNRGGDVMMWTSQRGGAASSDERPSSQVWMARFDFEAFIDAFSADDAAARDD